MPTDKKVIENNKESLGKKKQQKGKGGWGSKFSNY